MAAMSGMKCAGWAFAVLMAACARSAAQAAPLRIVAAERVYGDVASQIGGDRVSVVSILTNPAQDPHLFEVTPSTARAVSAARLVVLNGASYDPWMDRLLVAARAADRHVIVAASLAGLAPGADPHIWYDPAVMSAVAQAITRDLVAADPQDEAGFEHRLEDFRRTLEPARDAIRRFRATHTGIAVTATEPVFAYMLAALGVDVRNRRFQIDVMNGTEPSAADVAAFETSLRSHQVRLLIYNSQVTDALTERMRGVAEASGIPVLGVPETEPAGMDYQHWIGTELRLVSDALSPTE